MTQLLQDDHLAIKAAQLLLHVAQQASELQATSFDAKQCQAAQPPKVDGLHCKALPIT